MDFDEQVARYRTLLAGRRVLVVLDNAADTIQIRPLLPGSPTCAVLITSRSFFYSLEGAAPLTLDVLAPQTAVELAHRQRSAVPELCIRAELDGG